MSEPNMEHVERVKSVLLELGCPEEDAERFATGCLSTMYVILAETAAENAALKDQVAVLQAEDL